MLPGFSTLLFRELTTVEFALILNLFEWFNYIKISTSNVFCRNFSSSATPSWFAWFSRSPSSFWALLGIHLFCIVCTAWKEEPTFTSYLCILHLRILCSLFLLFQLVSIEHACTDRLRTIVDFLLNIIFDSLTGKCVAENGQWQDSPFCIKLFHSRFQNFLKYLFLVV